MEYYSAKRKNEILAFVGKWMELEDIMLSKISQRHRKSNMFSLTCRNLRKKTRMT
jgi:hypothetical protein